MKNCNKIFYDKDCNIIVQDSSYESGYAYTYILQLNTIEGSKNQVFIKTSEDEEIKFNLGLDGFYTLITIKIPYDISSPYYYKNGSFYKNVHEVSLEEIINVNPEVSGLEVTYDYYFQTCRLRKCYIKVCQDIFDQQATISCNKKDLDKELIYKRDLLWSALNVIQYMAEMNQFEEAERLLERIMGCNGLCNNHPGKGDSHISDCGCNK